MSDPRPSAIPRVETVRDGVTWKKFVLELPVEAHVADAREFVPSLDDPARVFATNAFAFLTRSGRFGPDDLRELGRSLCCTASAQTAPDYLGGFATIGFGHLDMEALPLDRYRFTARDLRLSAEQVRAPSCALALGFCEGLVERITGRPALGAEVTCRSMGHEACTFAVSVRG